MTLILTCLTNNFIVQASDRRLVYKRHGEFRSKEDNRNKALIYENHTVFAYTGLAKLSHQMFSVDWAAERLAQKATFEEALIYLKDCATQLMKTSPFSSYPNDIKRLAFVGAGFVNYVEATKTTRQPSYLIISNFMNSKGEPQSPPYNEFNAYASLPLSLDKPTFKLSRTGQLILGDGEKLLNNTPLFLDKTPFKLFRAGQELTGDAEKQLNKALERYFKRYGNAVRHETIGWLLTRAIRKSSEWNKYVGNNIICTFVPREYREDTGDNREIHLGGMMFDLPGVSEESQQLTPQKHLSDRERFSMPPLLDLPRCLYIPGDDSSLPLFKAVNVYPGSVIPEICTSDFVVNISPVRSTGDGEIEITAGDWSSSFTAMLIDPQDQKNA